MRAWLTRNKIIFETLVAASLLAVGLQACAGEPVLPTLPEEATQEQTQEWTIWPTALRYPIEIVDEGPNWTVFLEEGGGNIFTVFDHEGNEFYREHAGRDPRFALINKDLLKMEIGIGSGAWNTVFFDLVQGIHSPDYFNLDAYGYGKIANTEWYDWQDEENGRFTVLVVHDMLNPEQNRNIFELDFWTQSNPIELPPEIIDEMNEFGLFQRRFRAIEFLSATQLYVEYLNSNAEFVAETLILK